MNHQESLSVSVVIPHYNASNSIGRALESIKQQSRQPFEVLIIDDHSQSSEYDKLRSIVSEYENSLNIKLTRLSTNQGPSTARNLGWGQSKGSAIAFLDSDETWLPQKIELQARHFSDGSYDILGTTSRFAQETKNHELTTRENVQQITANDLLLRNRFHTSTVMIRRELPFRFPEDLSHSEDYNLWCQVLFSGAKGGVLQIPLTYYYKSLRGTNGLSGNLWKMYTGQIKSFHSFRQEGSLNLSKWAFATSIASLRFIRHCALVLLTEIKSKMKSN